MKRRECLSSNSFQRTPLWFGFSVLLYWVGLGFGGVPEESLDKAASDFCVSRYSLLHFPFFNKLLSMTLGVSLSGGLPHLLAWSPVASFLSPSWIPGSHYHGHAYIQAQAQTKTPLAPATPARLWAPHATIRLIPRPRPIFGPDLETSMAYK